MNFFKNFKFKLFLGAILFFVSADFVFASEILNDNFDSYGLGAINGTSTWSASPSFVVDNGTPYQGTNYLKVNLDSLATATTTAAQDGSLTFWAYLSYSATGTGAYPRMYLRDDDGSWLFNLYYFDDGKVKFSTGEGTTEVNTYATSTWYRNQIEFRSSDHKVRYNFNNGSWTTWQTPLGPWGGTENVIRFTIENFGTAGYYAGFDYFGETAISSTITITSPNSSTTQQTPLNLNISYNVGELPSQWVNIQIFFNQMATDTCPAYLSNDWVYNYQNNTSPIFSGVLNQGTGTTTATIYGSNIPNTGNNWCAVCQFQDTYNGVVSGDKCNSYKLNFATTSQATYFQLWLKSWPDYYASSNSQWATSTTLFNDIATPFQNFFDKIAPYAGQVLSFLNSNEAKTKGQEYGSAIPTIRGYLVPINNLFGNLPISQGIIFVIVFMIAVFAWKFLKSVLEIIKSIRPF